MRRDTSIELRQKLINLHCIILWKTEKFIPNNNKCIRLLKQQIGPSTSTSTKKRKINVHKYFIELKTDIDYIFENKQTPAKPTPARVRQFQHINADKTFNGESCVCCTDDL